MAESSLTTRPPGMGVPVCKCGGCTQKLPAPVCTLVELLLWLKGRCP